MNAAVAPVVFIASFMDLGVVEFGIDGLCGVTHGKVDFRAAFVSFKSDGSADIACCAKYDDIDIPLSHGVV